MKKVLMITGGSRGIGLAAIRRFLSDGYQVINLSRSKPDEAAIHHFPVDLADDNSTSQVLDQLKPLIEEAGKTVLIHNSGLLQKDNIQSITTDALTRSLQVNVVASTLITSRLLPMMKPGSSILYVGSTLGEKAVANSLSYVVAKHAQVGLMKSNCQDLVGTGVHTACVCPGFTDTEMLRDHIGNDPEVVAAISSGVAAGRLVSPDEIAETLFFCANNPVINGSVIHANLGQIEN